ncbi:MAG: DUF4292 domain-containing protein [Flavobacteriales bacterium]
MSKYIFIVILLATFAYGCKSKKKVLPTAISNEYRERDELIQALDSACCDFEGVEIKTGLKLDMPTQKINNLKAIFRINTDSVIWASITFSGLPIGNALFTRDSIKMLARQPKKIYYMGTYKEINEQFGLQLNYNFLQDFLYARPLEFVNSEKMTLRTKDDYYEFRNTGNSGTLGLEEVTKTYRFSKSDLTYKSLEAESKKDTVTVKLKYEKYEKIDNCFFPHTISMYTKKAEKETKIVLDINKISIGRQLEMPFKLTDSYEPLQFGK